MLGREHLDEVLLEIGAHDPSAAPGEAGVVKRFEKGRGARRNDGVEDELGVARHDPPDRLAKVRAVERMILLPDDRAAGRRDQRLHLPVHGARPDVFGRRQVNLFRARFLHDPGDERGQLLRGGGAGAEEERIPVLALVLLRIDVERPSFDDGRSLDRLPGGAEDAADHEIDLFTAHELAGLVRRYAVGGFAVFDDQLHGPPEKASARIDVLYDHSRHIGVGLPHEGQGAGQSAICPTLMDDVVIGFLLAWPRPKGRGHGLEDAGGDGRLHGEDSLCGGEFAFHPDAIRRKRERKSHADCRPGGGNRRITGNDANGRRADLAPPLGPLTSRKQSSKHPPRETSGQRRPK